MAPAITANKRWCKACTCVFVLHSLVPYICITLVPCLLSLHAPDSLSRPGKSLFLRLDATEDVPWNTCREEVYDNYVTSRLCDFTQVFDSILLGKVLAVCLFMTLRLS